MILLGGFIQAFFFLIGRFIYIKCTTGKFWNWENSGFRDPITDKFRWSAVIAVVLDAIIKVLAGWCVIISFKYALYAGINQGAITTIYAMSSIYVAFISWFVFSEKLNKFHIIGMLFLVSCAILIVLSKTPSSGDKVHVYDSDVDQLSPMWPVFISIGTSLIYSCRTIYVKLFVHHLKFNSYDFMTYSYLLSGGVFIPHVFQSMKENDFVMEVIFLGVLSGILNSFASFFLFYATSTGVTGPAYALKNLEPVIQGIFGSIIFGIYLNGMQMFAILLGIFGSLTLTLGPALFPIDKEKVT